jgi:hypothetical protein
MDIEDVALGGIFGLILTALAGPVVRLLKKNDNPELIDNVEAKVEEHLAEAA